MQNRINLDEFHQLMEPWDDRVRDIVEKRLSDGYARQAFENFDEKELEIMRALLARLIPDHEGIDLASFIDGRLWDPLGRGDRAPGMPDEKEVIKIGLRGLEEAAVELDGEAFAQLDGARQDALIGKAARGEIPGAAWKTVPPKYFFQRFYARALTGYYAHPLAWMRIGFYGPGYPEGYVWLGRGQVKQRHERAPGWERM